MTKILAMTFFRRQDKKCVFLKCAYFIGYLEKINNSEHRLSATNDQCSFQFQNKKAGLDRIQIWLDFQV